MKPVEKVTQDTVYRYFCFLEPYWNMTYDKSKRWPSVNMFNYDFFVLQKANYQKM